MDFETKLEKYAQVIVRVGVNLQPGQRLLMWNPPYEAAPLVRAVAKTAYQAGAKLVVPVYDDEQMEILRIKHGSDESIEEYDHVAMDAVEKFAARGDALLSIQGLPPDYLKGLDEERVKKLARVRTNGARPYVEAVTSSKVQWSAVRTPTQAWADMVLPGLPESERVQAFWDWIFKLSRADGDDPVTDWQAHIANLAKRKDFLNEKQYAALKYSGPGTDLTIGLPAGHKWEGGQEHTISGIPHTANIPTEEVYTMPHRTQVDGVVRSTKPLDHGGVLMEDFTIKFEEGAAVHVEAKVGEDYLKSVLETDETARFTGEVALVPHSSPISQSGLVFYDGLYDENASCHIALGASYKTNMQGGLDMSDEEFVAAGGNDSQLHLDFMIGSGELDIDGITQDGKAEALMRAGEWAFEV
ncbi:MAG: aminopeptidase [Anaerolineae bacterium]|nr:aminopeptidase [Anaerolineae bacterium]